MNDTILVVGGTGTVGTPLVRELVGRGAAVRVASRRPTDTSDAKVQTVRLDLSDPASFDAALDGVSSAYVLSPAGSPDIFGLLNPLLETAGARGIKVVLQSAMGVDADDNIPFRRLELGLERSGGRYVILRPNWFTDNLLTYWARDVREGEIKVPAGEGKTSFIDARDIAAAGAAALTTDRFDGQAFNLTGPEALSYGQVAELVTQVTGRAVGYRSIDDEEFIARRVEDGFAEPYARMLAAIFYPVREGWTATVTDAVKTLTGAEPRTVSAFVRENARRLA